jgi:hypothetical protein
MFMCSRLIWLEIFLSFEKVFFFFLNLECLCVLEQYGFKVSIFLCSTINSLENFPSFVNLFFFFFFQISMLLCSRKIRLEFLLSFETLSLKISNAAVFQNNKSLCVLHKTGSNFFKASKI